MLADRTSELVPVQTPASYYVPIDLQDALATALKNRPDIDAAAQDIEAARIRLKVAKNELLPVLDAVLETYVSGLRDDYDIGGAWNDQFKVGKPSYTAGLVFENPIHRRAAKANHDRRRLELRQLSNQFEATVGTLNANVEVAVREVETGFREMQSRYQAMLAAQSDASYLQRRWESLPGDDRAASFMLEDLLDSQDRLATAEFDFTRAQVEYTLSLTYLNRATGSLLKQEQVEMVRGRKGGLPTIMFQKADAATVAPLPLRTASRAADKAESRQ
jgi:outer membrane protein